MTLCVEKILPKNYLNSIYFDVVTSFVFVPIYYTFREFQIKTVRPGYFPIHYTLKFEL